MTWPTPQQPQHPGVQILELRRHLQLRVTPLPPDLGHQTSLLDVRLWRRTPDSILPGDYSATSSGFRVPQSRVGELVTMLVDAEAAALRLGVWPDDD